jgi:excisionase family DNA binding protein
MNDQLMENHPLLTMAEAANRLKVSIRTIRTWVTQRRIPSIKAGRCILIEMEDLMTYVGSLLVESTDHYEREK